MLPGVGSMPLSYASSLARFHRLGPASAPITSEKTANTAASAASTRIGTYRLNITSPPCYSRSQLRRRGHLRQGIEEAVDCIAAPGLGEVTEELHREAHDVGPLDAVPGREPHERRMADRVHERAAERVVAAPGVLELPRVGVQHGLRARGRGPGQRLDDGPGGDLAGLQRVGDALAVERVDHPAGVPGQ